MGAPSRNVRKSGNLYCRWAMEMAIIQITTDLDEGYRSFGEFLVNYMKDRDIERDKRISKGRRMIVGILRGRPAYCDAVKNLKGKMVMGGKVRRSDCRIIYQYEI